AFANNLSPRKYGWNPWIGLTAHDLLHGRNNLRSNHNRVNILVRVRPMTSFTFHTHKQFITGRHIFPGTKSDFSGFDKGHYMLSDYASRTRPFQYPFFNHERGTPWQSFFSRLKNQLYPSSENRS